MLGWACGASGTVLKTTNGGVDWTLDQSGTDQMNRIQFLSSSIGFMTGVNKNISKSTNGGFNWIHEINQTDIYSPINTVFFANNNIGWAGGGDMVFPGRGGNGFLLKTTNSGQSWSSQYNPGGYGTDIYDIHFSDTLNGCFVGSDGTIMITSNGGASWEYRGSDYFLNDLYKMSFADYNTGWVIGHDSTIFKTTDLGNSWTIQAAGKDETPNDIFFVDANNGWCVHADGLITHTSNGGVNWYYQNSNTTNQLQSVYFYDSNTGWAIGALGTIIKTTDGGSNWVNQTSGTSEWLFGLYFLDDSNGWISGYNGTVLRTSDGGENWTQIFDGLNYYCFNSIYFIDDSTGWAAGAYQGYYGVIFKTTDGGNNWTVQQNYINGVLYKVVMNDYLNGCAVGENGIIKRTTDGGINWITIPSATTYNFYDLQFFNSNTGYAISSSLQWDYPPISNLYKTTDGGLTWNIVSNQWGDCFTTIGFINENLGWAAGWNGWAYNDVICKTINSGNSWGNQWSPKRLNLNSVYFTDSNNGWVAGDYGKIMNTTDGGSTWTDQISNTPYNLHSIFFISTTTGWAVGEGGTILKTMDGGLNWSNQTSGTIYYLTSIVFTDENTGWVSCDGGLILNTSDGGNNWTIHNIGTWSRLTGINFSDPQTAWVVSQGTDIFKFSCINPFTSTQLIYPDNNSINLPANITFTWQPVDGVTAYTLQVSIDRDFVNLVVDRTGISEAQYYVDSLQNHTDYYWRVNVTNGSQTSSWTDVWSFTTECFNLGNTISGLITYSNNLSTPLSNCSVNLYNNQNILIAQTLSNELGRYEIIDVPNGNYSIKVSTGKAWGGLNIVDVIKTRKKIAYLLEFSPLQTRAADVDTNQALNIIDIIIMRQRLAFMNPPQWVIPDFIFENPKFIVCGEDQIINIHALCAGDVNGSYIPQ
jgi:photosystem II stability/assembly factor-like uncharacterized protein